MYFTKVGEFLSVSRIAGPRHNLLQLALSTAPVRLPVCERLPAQGSCSHKPLSEEAIVQAVVEGVAEANTRFGSSYSATHIRYIASDTPPEAVYGFLALKIVERIAEGEEFSVAHPQKCGLTPVQ